MPHRSLPVLRRTTLAAAPLLVLAGCEWGPGRGSTDLPGAAPSTPPDAEQVRAAVAAIRAADALLTAVTGTHIGLSDAFTPLTRMHGSHLELLDAGEDDPEDTAAPRVSSKAALAWKQVVTSEQKLSTELARLAGEVSSGQLARVLAAMAAGGVQRVAELPAPPRGQA
ncbi:hypothetical protein BJ980_001022 [Nocardioides daedukensis]|uniref:DUF4439 domain-containing protein n=1 Tax=Nocardioides daedukensis TaxID=634462 RepID=A0A7Y9RZB4_9ACTN|nr:hypothetical protein [Nocardioides daedukensis]NYG58099.1 hypothetical protein [Nocardioides daedukensis]